MGQFQEKLKPEKARDLPTQGTGSRAGTRTQASPLSGQCSCPHGRPGVRGPDWINLKARASSDPRLPDPSQKQGSFLRLQSALQTPVAGPLPRAALGLQEWPTSISKQTKGANKLILQTNWYFENKLAFEKSPTAIQTVCPHFCKWRDFTYKSRFPPSCRKVRQSGSPVRPPGMPSLG